MKAVGYQTPLPVSDRNALLDIELEKPVATGRDILVRVEAIAVNPVDTKVRKSAKPEPGEYKILGWDVAGVVDSVGEGVTLFRPGDAVWYAGAIDRPGANSEYHLVDERIVAQKPKSLTFEQAAALPLTSITAWELLFDRMRAGSETTGRLLIIGAAGGVGSIMIQLAKVLTNLTAIATASRTETKEWVASLGADFVIDHSRSLLEELHASGLDLPQYVASLNHTEQHLDEIAKLIAPQGHLGLIEGPKVLDINPFKSKSVSVYWEFMFTRSMYGTDDMIAQHKLLSRVAEMVDAGEIKTTVTKNMGRINAENLRAAHALIESGKSIGKVVLSGF